LHPRCQALDLRGFAGAVKALESDEQSARHAESLPPVCNAPPVSCAGDDADEFVLQTGDSQFEVGVIRFDGRCAARFFFGPAAGLFAVGKGPYPFDNYCSRRGARLTENPAHITSHLAASSNWLGRLRALDRA
jgi:hypothetical protein